MGDKVFQGDGAHRNAGTGGVIGQGEGETDTRLQQSHHHQPQAQGHQGGQHEPAQGLGPDAAHGAGVAHLGDADHQGAEDQGGDDHLDQSQEDIGKNRAVAGEIRRLIGGKQTITLTGEDAKHHRNEDGDRQLIHFHGGFSIESDTSLHQWQWVPLKSVFVIRPVDSG